jgi:alpha-L-fucosidase
VYLSPWDRNRPDYGGASYVNYYREQMKELLSDYGPVFEVWFDGANGGDGFYGGAREKRNIIRNYYQWEEAWKIIRDLQPDACIFGDVGAVPDIRWVGNEKGIAGDPCWHTFDCGRFSETEVDPGTLNSGEPGAPCWVPAECDVSIRPGWFYHPEEDAAVRSPENLFDLYLKSVGRGASLLLNVPPDARGGINEGDKRALTGFGRKLSEIFNADIARRARVISGPCRGNSRLFSPSNLLDGNRSTCWAVDDGIESAEVVLEFPGAVTFNMVGLKEFISLGQRIKSFAVDVYKDREWVEYVRGTAVGNRRLIKKERCTTERVRLRICKSLACPVLSEMNLFLV